MPGDRGRVLECCLSREDRDGSNRIDTDSTVKAGPAVEIGLDVSLFYVQIGVQGKNTRRDGGKEERE